MEYRELSFFIFGAFAIFICIYCMVEAEKNQRQIRKLKAENKAQTQRFKELTEARFDIFKVFYNVVVAENRQTGTSTGLALSYIGKAILFPGKKIYIKDHHGTKQSDKLLINTVNHKINELKLKGFKLNRTDSSIVFSLDKLKAEA